MEEEALELAEIAMLLAAARRRYPETKTDPMNVGGLFGPQCSDQDVCEYLWSLRHYIMQRLRDKKRKVKPSKRAELAMALSPPKKREREENSEKVDDSEFKRLKRNNRAIIEAIRDHREPSSIEWARWRDDNPEYQKKTKSRKRERESDNDDDVVEPLSTRRTIEQREEYADAAERFSSDSSEF